MGTIQLGDLVRDIISGFEGVITGKTEWLNGCVRYMLEPRSLDKDGNRVAANWFDSAQVELVTKAVIPSFESLSEEAEAERTGGPPVAGDPTR